MKFKSDFLDKIEAKEADYLFIKESQIENAGKGLFTSINIYKNEIISLFKGKILTDEEAKHKADRGEDRFFINMLDGTIMDSMNVKCFAKYANDAENFVKTGFANNSTITLDENNNVCLAAIRDIKEGEEIFVSYGKKYWRNFRKKNKID
jgi:SET domain-containing protein